VHPGAGVQQIPPFGTSPCTECGIRAFYFQATSGVPREPRGADGARSAQFVIMGFRIGGHALHHSSGESLWRSLSTHCSWPDGPWLFF
jgi:hypothetical protein